MSNEQNFSAAYFRQFHSNLKGGLKEAYDVVRDYPQRFKGKSRLGKAFSIAKIASLPATVIVTPEAGVLAQTTGLTALTAVYILPRLKNNKHINALSVPLAYTLSIQKLLLGASGYAIMAGIAGTRNLTMSMMADTPENQPLRNKIALGFAFAGISAIGVTGIYLSPWNFLPMGSMLLGTFASSRINSNSHQSRAMHMVANTNNGIYSWFYSGSGQATLIDAISASSFINTTMENDIPVARKDGKPMGVREKINGYLGGIFNNQHCIDTYVYPRDLPKAETIAPPVLKNSP